MYCCRADDLSVVKILVQLTLTVARHHSSAVELCRDIACDLHICVGDIDQVSLFGALTLSVGQQDGHPVYKSWVLVLTVTI